MGLRASFAEFSANTLQIVIERQRLIRGKPFKVAITACMRKLLVILNALVGDNKFWRTSAMNT
jgi:hypothetical protein